MYALSRRGWPVPVFLVSAAVCACSSPSAQVPAGAPSWRVEVRATSWPEAAPIAQRLEDILPQSLRDGQPDQRAARWTAWRDAHRRAVASRIAQGDVDSVVNLMLFGTSFTTQPRITVSLLTELDRRWRGGDASAREALLRAYRTRAEDLVTAAARTGAGERLRDVRAILGQQGHTLTTTAQRNAAIDYLLESVVRVRQEAAALAKQLEALRAQPDATVSFAERSRLFHDRGLSADSSVLTQFAVDRALAALVDREILAARSVSRLAIVGPGLDFVDKQEGFDFYEPQTLQPFTAVDSLYRSGLASGDLRVTTVDISARVNGHIRQAVDRAAGNRSYQLVLPWDSRAGRLDDALAYWRRAGDRVGKSVALTAPPLPDVMARAIAVRPDVVRRVQAVDASIVSDRLVLSERDRFDLVIATNVLVYYDRFEQTLALASIAAMLRPGGVLLTNDAVLEIPEVPLGSQGYLAVAFSKREGDGERMIWYVRDGR